MKTGTQSLDAKLAALNACEDARGWAKGYATLQEAWDACERADWMLWLLVKLHGYKGQVVHATVDCAETALPIYEKHRPGDMRVRDCLSVTRRWADGKATKEELREARRNAAACAYAAADAADAAAACADAADDAAYAYAYAAAADADAADADAADDAWRKARIAALARMAVLIRQRVPNPEGL